MGDRANIVVKHKASEVWLYSHWRGDELLPVAARSIRRAVLAGRAGDGAYLARIIFSDMIKDNVSGTTGYGISSVPKDGQDRIIYVNVDDQLCNGIPFGSVVDGAAIEFMSIEELEEHAD
jgi:hypothetical protein